MLGLYKLERREGVIKWVLQGSIGHSHLPLYPGIVYLGFEDFTKSVKKFIDFSEDHLTAHTNSV